MIACTSKWKGTEASPSSRTRSIGSRRRVIPISADAPALENTLHRTFHHRRVNRVNERKEFFKVTIEEIAEVVRRHNSEIEITLAAEAVEYRKTLAMLQDGQPVRAG